MTDQVINMSEHFDVEASLEAAVNERFAMPAPVIAAFRQAAMQTAQHLLNTVSSPDFSKLPIKDQIKVMELVFDRAYGKSETASSSMLALSKTGQLDSNGDHGKQLEEISARMDRTDRKFPELKKARATRQVALASQPSQSDTQERADRLPMNVLGDEVVHLSNRRKAN